MQLLAKARQINQKVQNSQKKFECIELLTSMSEVFDANIVVLNKEEEVLFSTAEVPESFSQTVASINRMGENAQTGSTWLVMFSMKEGKIILFRPFESFTEEEMVAGEYASIMIEAIIEREKVTKEQEMARKRTFATSAMDALSYSEMEAIKSILEELDGKEGLLIASKVADKQGITRSVIVNALRKLESAGVLQSRSLGMKGTHIKILNEEFVSKLA